MTVSRRRFLSLGVGAFVVLTLPAALRRMGRGARRSIPVMGTIADLVVVDPDEAKAQGAIDAAIRELRWVERTMSHYSADSDVGRANLNGAVEAVPVTAATATVLEDAIRWAEASDGRFDPCLGKASSLWNVGERQNPPAASAIARFAGELLYRELEVGRWRGEPVVRLRSDAAAIDLGGIAKGYGIDRAVQALKARGISRGFLNAGGDMYCWGLNPQGRPWQIGIKHPREEGYWGVLSIRDLGAATAGDYQRYFIQNGVRYHHIFDPRTGSPARGKQSVTVVGPETSVCDALSTALFVSESPERILTHYPEYGAYLVYADGKQASMGKDFPFRLGLVR